MATPAQFSIILYSEKEFVGADGQPVEKTFNFQLPSDAVLSPAILQFMVHTTANVDELAADISINGKRVYHYGTSSGIPDANVSGRSLRYARLPAKARCERFEGSQDKRKWRVWIVEFCGVVSPAHVVSCGRLAAKGCVENKEDRKAAGQKAQDEGSLT